MLGAAEHTGSFILPTRRGALPNIPAPARHSSTRASPLLSAQENTLPEGTTSPFRGARTVFLGNTGRLV